MSGNLYGGMTKAMLEVAVKNLLGEAKAKTLFVSAKEAEKLRGEMLKFRRFAQPTPPTPVRTIPAYELELIVKAAEVRAFREAFVSLPPDLPRTDETQDELFKHFETLREAYTESGKARYIIEHGVPEDTSDRNAGPGSARMLGFAAIRPEWMVKMEKTDT